mmetsp:Transcript_23216/g.33894  ORF Transcript_23216/g.33894 Transcript_23216/m.33894 type:complete len:331 (+) Transcript_23216:1047-2039(+)
MRGSLDDFGVDTLANVTATVVQLNGAVFVDCEVRLLVPRGHTILDRRHSKAALEQFVCRIEFFNFLCTLLEISIFGTFTPQLRHCEPLDLVSIRRDQLFLVVFRVGVLDSEAVAQGSQGLFVAIALPQVLNNAVHDAFHDVACLDFARTSHGRFDAQVGSHSLAFDFPIGHVVDLISSTRERHDTERRCIRRVSTIHHGVNLHSKKISILVVTDAVCGVSGMASASHHHINVAGLGHAHRATHQMRSKGGASSRRKMPGQLASEAASTTAICDSHTVSCNSQHFRYLSLRPVRPLHRRANTDAATLIGIGPRTLRFHVEVLLRLGTDVHV